MQSKIYFSVNTPLNIEVRITNKYWEYIVTFKHPVMKNKEDVVKIVLQTPDEIRQSKMDKEVFLYYKTIDKLYCAVVKHIRKEGFLITTYPTDRVKEGNIIWIK